MYLCQFVEGKGGKMPDFLMVRWRWLYHFAIVFFVCYQYDPYAMFIICIVNDLIFNGTKINASLLFIIFWSYNSIRPILHLSVWIIMLQTLLQLGTIFICQALCGGISLAFVRNWEIAFVKKIVIEIDGSSLVSESWRFVYVGNVLHYMSHISGWLYV